MLKFLTNLLHNSIKSLGVYLVLNSSIYHIITQYKISKLFPIIAHNSIPTQLTLTADLCSQYFKILYILISSSIGDYWLLYRSYYEFIKC